MFNDNEDDESPVDFDSEVSADLEDAGEDVEGETEAAPPKLKKKPAAKKRAAVRSRKSAEKAPPAKAAAKSAKKAAKSAKRKAAGRKAKVAATPPSDLTGVKAGAHTLWVSKALARSLTSKDRRKLKALLKRAEKRGKAKKK